MCADIPDWRRTDSRLRDDKRLPLNRTAKRIISAPLVGGAGANRDLQLPQKFRNFPAFTV